MAETAPLRTTLTRKWLVKMWIFTLFLLGLGVWGAIDAWVVYPKRGERHAMNVAARGGRGGVHVSVRVNPQQTDLTAGCGGEVG